jgi:hypothetical protein
VLAHHKEAAFAVFDGIFGLGKLGQSWQSRHGSNENQQVAL